MERNKQKIINYWFFYAFCVVELLMLIALKLVQSLLPQSNAKTYLMFVSTFLNALFMAFLVLQVKRSGKDIAILGLPLAAFVILFADVFLVLIKDLTRVGVFTFMTVENAKTIGFFIFGLVQVIYAYYLGLNKSRILIRVGFYAVFIVVVLVSGLYTPDKLSACLSMSQLILNIVYAWIEYDKKHTRASLLFAIAISIFFVGDALITVRMFLHSDSLIREIVRFLVWVFYIPSLVLLTFTYLIDRTDA